MHHLLSCEEFTIFIKVLHKKYEYFQDYFGIFIKFSLAELLEQNVSV